MEKTEIEKISEIIKKLKKLKKANEEYQAKYPNFPIAGTPDPAGNPYWSQNVQPLVDEIDLELVNLEDCINAYTLPEDNFGGFVCPTGTFTQNLWRDIRHALNSREADLMHPLIQQSKKIRRRLEIKSEQQQEQDETTEKPAETRQGNMRHPTIEEKDLTQIANNVHKYVQNEENKACFQKWLIAFRKARSKFDQALKKAQEAAMADPKLRYDYDDVRDKGKEPPKPPRKDYELEDHYVLDEPPKGFWRPPLPFNPDGYLQRFQCKLFGLFTREEEPRNRNQMLMCEFALIAAIHDKALDLPVCDRLTDIEKDDWVELLWRLLSTEGSTANDYKTFLDRKRNINTAFNNVRTNLPVKTDVALENTETDFVKKTVKKEPENIIFIDLKQFNKGTGSFVLLTDLIEDKRRDGVILNETRHGKKQPQSLREMLIKNSYEDVAKKVKLKKKKVTLDIPIKKISTDS